MDDFKAGKIKCLVATDVAARGIDVNDLAMVINYDLPNEAENYVHRIGRTARAGKSGKAYTFCSEQDVYSLPPIERYIEKQIPARVAEESMLGEDKSEGMYIRTENYHEDYNDKSEFGRRRQAEYERSGRGRRGRHAEGSGRARGERGKGRYSKGNKEASREYKRDRRVFNAEEEAMLATMSMDERMKLYKEKFASTSKTAAASTKQDGGKQAAGKQAGAKGKKASGKGKKSYKDSSRKQYSAKSEYSGKNRPQGKPSSAKEASGKKRGIFGRIKSLFSKK